MHKIQTDTANGFKILHVQYDSPISLILFLVKNGSRNEEKEKAGISHFIEHMMFKQTEKRSTMQIAMEIETLGGQANAFTTYEATGYYIKVLEENFDKSFEILSDIFQNGQFTEKDLEIERGNIIEEINMYEDSPSDSVWNHVHSNIYHENPLERPIIGYKETLEKIKREDLLQFLQTNYLQDDCLIVSVGKFDIERTKKNIQKNLNPRKSGKLSIEKAKFEPKEKINFHNKNEVNQTHLVMSFPGVETSSPEIYQYSILEEILGGGMGSLLFSEIREKLGIAYYVGASHYDYEDTGSFHIYFGANLDKTPMGVEKVFEILKKVKEKGISDHDLVRAQNYFFSATAMAHQSISYLGQKYGLEYLIQGKVEETEEIRQKTYAVTKKDIQRIANKIFDENYNITYIANKKML